MALRVTLTQMLGPYTIFKMVTFDCHPVRPAPCIGLTRRRHSTILLLGALAMLTVACSGGSEPVGAISTRGSGAVAPSVDKSSRPNTATLTWDAVTHPDRRGYRIYYGPEADMYLQLRGKGIDVGNVTTYTIRGLASR